MFSKIVFFVSCFAAKSPTGAKRHLDSSVLATSDINVHFRYWFYWRYRGRVVPQFGIAKFVYKSNNYGL
jgi:hypothetical protein